MSLQARSYKEVERPDLPRPNPRIPFSGSMRAALAGVRSAFGRSQGIESHEGAGKFAGAHLLKTSPAALAGTLLINAFGLVLPMAVLEVYDAIIPHQASETLILLVFGFICITAIEFFLRVGRSYVAGFGAAKFEAQNIALAVERIASGQREELDTEQDTRHVARVASIVRLSDYYGGQMRWALIDIPFVFLYIGCMALIAGWLAAVPVLLVVIFIFISSTITEPLLDTSRARDEEDVRIYDFIGETLSGVTAIKGTAMEAFMARRFERLVGRSRQLGRDTIIATGHGETLSSLFGNITFISIGAVGGLMAINGDLSIGSLAACTLLAGRVIQPIMRASGLVRSLNLLTVAREEASKVLAIPQHPPKRSGGDLPPRPQLCARALRLPAPIGAPAVDLDIRFGETVCITSSSSASQSALLLKLAGEHAGVEGEVRFGGEPVAGLSLAGRRGIVFVSPQTSLFDGTILQNLTAFGDGGTLEEAVEICDLFAIRKDIDRLPAGFDTVVSGQVHGGLPDSLARLIVLARAVALRPRLIVLDEPQTLLDRKFDQQLLEGLRQLRGCVTLIIGSQRPSYLALADRTFVLDQGHLQLRAPPDTGQKGFSEYRAGGQ